VKDCGQFSALRPVDWPHVVLRQVHPAAAGPLARGDAHVPSHEAAGIGNLLVQRARDVGSVALVDPGCCAVMLVPA
jgi:hypothetical protein